MFALLMMCVAAALLAGKGFLVDLCSSSVSDSGDLVCQLQSLTTQRSFGISAPRATLAVVYCRLLRERWKVRGPPRLQCPCPWPSS